MVRWSEVPGATLSDQASTRGRRFAPVAIALLAAAALAWNGWWAAVVVLAVALLAVSQASALDDGAAHWLRNAPRRAGRVLARLVVTVTLTGVFLLAVLPVSLVTAPFHRRPFGIARGQRTWITRVQMPGAGAPTETEPEAGAPSPSSDAANGDTPVEPPARSRRERTFVATPTRGSVPARRLLGRAALIVVLFLVVDVTVGAILSGTGLMAGDKGAFLAAQRWLEESMSSPVVRDEPWAEQYTDEGLRLFALRQEYEPFLVYGFQPFEGRYINTTDRERISYIQSLAPDDEPLRVAFFGGSVMWGVGQRDDYTIPSAFAKAAEAAGIPVEVHNYGMYGWVAWQEYQYLERLLAAGERYDLIVFYDGLNDYNVQFSDFSVDPTHGGSRILEYFGAKIHDDLYTAPGYLDGPRDLLDTYRNNSGVARIVDEISGPEADLPIWMRTEVPDEATAREAGMDVYGRSQRAIRALAAEYDIPVRFFFQAVAAGWPADLLDELPPGTIDASHVLDGVEDEVYIDGGHTNERGARLVAEYLWQEVGPILDPDDGS